MEQAKAQTPAETIIEVQDLDVSYDERPVLQGVGFTVDRGEIVVVAGPSGCGKSTLLKALIGLLEPDRGRVVILGVDLAQADEARLRWLRQQIGVLFQGSGLLSSMTLFGNISLPLREYEPLGKRSLAQVVAMKLGLVDMAGTENLYPTQLSGGMRKRAGLARAMALDPQVLFFDEPSAGLDPVTAAELDNLIIRLNQGLGTTMVIVTHELTSIFTIAHRVILLDSEAKGIIAQGEPHHLRDQSQDPRVLRFFRRQAREKR